MTDGQEIPPLWQPTPEQTGRTRLRAFMRQAEARCGRNFSDYNALHRWSLADPGEFWSAVWEFTGVIGSRGARTLIDGDKMPGARYFPDAQLNFAENLLRRNDAGDALVFRGEDRVQQRMSWQVLQGQVSRMAQAMRSEGLVAGDGVAGFLPNLPETIVAMLAATSIGAVWCSCSPDFGEQGVLDRFGQIEPRLLIGCDGYFYNGKRYEVLTKLARVAAALPSLRRVIVVPYLGKAQGAAAATGEVRDAVVYEDYLAPFAAAAIEFERLPFAHPLYILFSSGTTGAPKCIVHSAGGTLLQHLKEHQLHSDVHAGDRLFYFTTCTWMMWNWLVSGLASEATLLLYDGSPFYPSGETLFDFADAERMTHFGTSAKYIDALKKDGIHPRETHRLSDLRLLASTGSPLVAESFDFVYEHIKQDVCLASIAGGTDIVSCFVLGNPIGPVWRGEIACRGLGMAVEVWNEHGMPVVEEKGELVCTAPFPSMPVGFWNDPGDEKYRAAYFEKWPDIWAHGDFAEITARGGIVIHGRSDATLNPGGVRIGTAEIYRQVEQIDSVLESIVIGQAWDDDVRIVLFIVLREGLKLDEALVARIRRRIREGASPRHVPAVVVQVRDIPRTKSGKITELAVRDVVEGREIKNKEALANPEALELYRNLPELA